MNEINRIRRRNRNQLTDSQTNSSLPTTLDDINYYHLYFMDFHIIKSLGAPYLQHTSINRFLLSFRDDRMHSRAIASHTSGRAAGVDRRDENRRELWCAWDE